MPDLISSSKNLPVSQKRKKVRTGYKPNSGKINGNEKIKRRFEPIRLHGSKTLLIEETKQTFKEKQGDWIIDNAIKNTILVQSSKIPNIFIRLTVLYACKIWTMNQRKEKKELGRAKWYEIFFKELK